MTNRLEDDSRRFQAEVDELVRRWARGDDREYWRRWKQLGSWSISRTQGDVVKKSALKRTLMEETRGHCQGCGRQFAAAALQMHRVDPTLAHDRSRNFGYVEGNVRLLCGECHERVEADRR